MFIRRKRSIHWDLTQTSETCLLATFDVQNGSLKVTDSTVGEVCITCHFVTGSQAQGCYVEFKSHKHEVKGHLAYQIH